MMRMMIGRKNVREKERMVRRRRTKVGGGGRRREEELIGDTDRQRQKVDAQTRSTRRRRENTTEQSREIAQKHTARKECAADGDSVSDSVVCQSASQSVPISIESETGQLIRRQLYNSNNFS